MSNYILGIDIGTTSCSAVAVEVDKNQQPLKIIAERTQIFSPPYKHEKSGYISKAATRREKRQHRRQTDRRAYRKKALVNWLEKQNITTSEAIGKVICTPELRAKSALEQVTLPELGSVLLKIAKRRGYSGKLNKVDGKVAKDNAALQQLLDDLPVDNPTIGHLLHHLNQQGLSTRLEHHGMAALRAQYQHEVEQILTVQAQFYPQLKDIRDELTDFLFYQQPLKSTEHLVGPCEIEPRHHRALTASSEYQEFRIVNLVNNLRWSVVDKQQSYLTSEQQSAIANLLRDPELLDDNANLRFETIRERLEEQGLIDPSIHHRFTHERRSSSTAKGEHTRLAFYQLGLLEAWGQLDSINQNRLLHLLSEDSFRQIADTPEDVCQYLSETKPNQSLAKRDANSWQALLDFTLALIAIKPNPSLQDCGLEIGRASYCSKVLNQLTDFLTSANDESERNAIAYLKFQRLKQLEKSNLDKIDEEWQELKCNVKTDLLTHVEEISNYGKSWSSLKSYPLPAKTGNPVVDRALRQSGYVIKSIIECLGLPQAIRIETARELSFGPKKRNEWENKQKNNAQRNDAARKKLAQCGMPVTARNIKRYKLWQEQKCDCPYCGQTITFESAMSGHDTNFEHIQPKNETGIGLRMHELVLAHRACNRSKNDQWPMIAFGSDPQRRQAIQDMVRHFRSNSRDWYGNHKADLLSFEPADGHSRPQVEDDSVAWADAQMQATSWIACSLNQWLRPSKVPLFFTKGSLTAKLRQQWQLNDVIPKVRFAENRAVWKVKSDAKGQDVNLLASAKEFEEHLKARALLKTSRRFQEQPPLHNMLRLDKRVDHRHHAIDALVIALSSPSLMQKYRQSALFKRPFKPELPYSNLPFEAEEMVSNCNLYHTPDRHPPKLFFKDSPRSIAGEFLAKRESVKSFAECKNTKELKKQIDKIVSSDTQDVFYQHIKRRCAQLNITIDPDSGLPTQADRELIRSLFVVVGITDTPQYGVEDQRYGQTHLIKKVQCYCFTSANKAKATSAWVTTTKTDVKQHFHAWQVGGNACLMLNKQQPKNSKVLSNIEFYSMVHSNANCIFKGDTATIEGRRMLVRQLNVDNRIILTDTVEASSMKVLKKLKDSQSAPLKLGKTRFKELIS
ncbi:type II CRISPR RNA-guided endonuclease Cas9 [Vibrio sp. DNB22_19_2]